MEDKKFFLPYLIEDEETRISMLKKSLEVKLYRFGKKLCLCAMVENYDEARFHNYMRETWNYLKEKENSLRCPIPDEKGGFIICRKNCSNCDKTRCGLPGSLDFQEAETGLEVVDSSPDPFERATLGIVLEDLSKALCKQSPSCGKIFDEICCAEKSQEEVAIFSDKSTGTVGEQFKKTVSLARKVLEKNGYTN